MCCGRYSSREPPTPSSRAARHLAPPCCQVGLWYTLMQHTRGEKGHIRAAAEKRLQKRRSLLSVDPLYMEVTTAESFPNW